MWLLLLLRPSSCLLLEYKAHLYFQIYWDILTYTAKIHICVEFYFPLAKKISRAFTIIKIIYIKMYKETGIIEKKIWATNKNIGRFSSEALQKSTETHLPHGLHLKQHKPKICLIPWLKLLRKYMHMTDSSLQTASPIKKADPSLQTSTFVRKSAKNTPHIFEHPTFYF